MVATGEGDALGSAVWLGLGMVADAGVEVDDDDDVDVEVDAEDEEDEDDEVVLPAKGLWLTPELVVVKTDFVYPGVIAHPKPSDPDA